MDTHLDRLRYFTNLSHQAYIMMKLVKSIYYDFTSEIIDNDNQYFHISNAYYENGVVFIEGVIKSGWKGDKQIQMIPSKYCPRIVSNVTLAYNSSNLDQNKISAMHITGSGNLYAWVIENLNYDERFSVTYPLKSV